MPVPPLTIGDSIVVVAEGYGNRVYARGHHEAGATDYRDGNIDG